MTKNPPIPCTTLATIADLRAGQWAAFGHDIAVLLRIRDCTPTARGSFRVEWDHGPGTRGHVRIMPGSNAVQVSW